MADYVAGLFQAALPTKEKKEKKIREGALVIAAEHGEDQLRIVEAYLATTETLDLGAIKEAARAWQLSGERKEAETPPPPADEEKEEAVTPVMDRPVMRAENEAEVAEPRSPLCDANVNASSPSGMTFQKKRDVVGGGATGYATG